MKTFVKFSGVLLVVFTAMLSVAQSDASATATPTKRTATIPFEFWIGDRQLPSGEYVIETVTGPDELLFRCKDGGKEEQVFLTPAINPVPKSNPKLVFVVHEGKSNLAEVWGTNHKRILTTRYGVFPQKGDTTREVAIKE
jgi:hypothetical protein